MVTRIESQEMAAILNSIQMNAPAASCPPTTNTVVNSVRSDPVHNVMVLQVHQVSQLQILPILEHPHPFVLPCLLQVHRVQHSPSIPNISTPQHADHSVAAIDAHELLDDASSLSATDKVNEVITSVFPMLGTNRDYNKHHGRKRSHNFKNINPFQKDQVHQC